MREPNIKLFVRVETYNLDEKRTQGGYICATETIMALKLGVSPDCTAEEWANLIEQSDDPEVHELLKIINLLCDIPQPTIYVGDKKNYYCLYPYRAFEDLEGDFNYISSLLYVLSKGKFCLINRIISMSDEDLEYSDGYQVVVSKETYKTLSEYTEINYMADHRVLDKYGVDYFDDTIIDNDYE